MKHLTITLLTLLILSGCDYSKKPSKPIEEPYSFSTAENTYIIEEHCLILSAQKCRTEDCNNLVPEFCKSQGIPYVGNQLISQETLIYSINSGTSDWGDRVRSIQTGAIANEEYSNIHACRYAESLKCKTNSCNDFVEGYCESFRYFKGEKLIAEEARELKRKEERERAYQILANPESTEQEKAEAYCNDNIFHTWNLGREDIVSCEDYYLMTPMERTEKGLPPLEGYSIQKYFEKK